MGQIVGEVLRQLTEEKFIVKVEFHFLYIEEYLANTTLTIVTALYVKTTITKEINKADNRAGKLMSTSAGYKWTEVCGWMQKAA